MTHLLIPAVLVVLPDSAKSDRNKVERGLAFDLAEEFDWSSVSVCTCWCSRRAAAL
jgi:hypothetical protein